MGVSGGKVVAPGDAAVQGASGAFGGTVDGDVKIGFGIVDGDGGSSLEAHFDAAALVDASPGSIDVGKSHHDARDNVAAVIHGIRQALGDVGAQAVGQVKVVGVDLDVHLIPRSYQGIWIMGTSTVRNKQIIVGDMFEKNG